LLVLHPTFWTQENHLEWWCGRADDKTGERQGYPSRHGIIVVSPRWSRQEQPSYEYTPAEQERVLRCLRHAMRRFSIDADRITIAGLGEGGAAAWDIALSHPDMWAGLVTISATADKTIRHYKRNSHYIPMYHVMGELDKTKPSGGILEEYMTFKHNAMVVAYRGRGKEYFFNEVPRICEWVANADNRRIPAPSEFEVDTMRGSDVSFWWLKVKDMPQSASIDPILWDRRSRIRSLTASGRLLGDNGLSFGGPGDRFEVSLAPTDGVRFDEEIRIKFGSRSIRYDFDNDIETILMDTKTRADRRRPVWMRMQVPQ
ncbi:MAG: alpha/beta hydrolase, partial [Planctomycetota bacterium]